MWHWLKRLQDVFILKENKKATTGNNKRKNILVLIDWENISLNIGFTPGEPSLKERLDVCIRNIAKQVGGIVDVFVFMPPHASYTWGEYLYRLGFFIIACPKVKSKTNEEIDTVDEILLKLGERMLDRTEGLTHLCLVSGDADLLPLLTRARLKGLKTVLIAANPHSLSAKMIPLIDEGPYFLISNSCAS